MLIDDFEYGDTKRFYQEVFDTNHPSYWDLKCEFCNEPTLNGKIICSSCDQVMGFTSFNIKATKKIIKYLKETDNYVKENS